MFSPEERRTKKPSRQASRKRFKSKKNSVASTSLKSLENDTEAFCKICKRLFSSEKMLNDHTIKHHFLRHCPNCPKTFKQTRQFIYHLRSHLNDPPYECKICLAYFLKKKYLLNHKKNHEICGYKLSNEFQCKICYKVFFNLHSVNRHQLTHDGPPYDCVACGAIFSNVRDRTVHIKNHVYRCKMCPKEVVLFSSSIDLVSHKYEFHLSDEEDTENEACVSTGAVNLGDFDSDSMNDSRSDDESDSDVGSNYQNEAVESVFTLKHKDRFMCFICYDLYPTHELLKFHMKAHKWHPCNSCPRFFANAEALENHECDFNTVMKHETCRNNSEAAVDIEGANANSLQSIEPTIPEIPALLFNYSDSTQY